MSKQLSRRTFMQASGAALAGSALMAAVTAAPAGEFSGKIKKAIKFNRVSEPGMNTLDKFKLVKDLGFDGIEPGVGEKVEPNLALATRAVSPVRSADQYGVLH